MKTLAQILIILLFCTLIVIIIKLINTEFFVFEISMCVFGLILGSIGTYLSSHCFNSTNATFNLLQDIVISCVIGLMIFVVTLLPLFEVKSQTSLIFFSTCLGSFFSSLLIINNRNKDELKQNDQDDKA